MKLSKRLLLILVIAVAIFTAAKFLGDLIYANDELYQKTKIMSLVLSNVTTKYVDDVNVDTLIAGTIKGMLKSLNDPYSRYLDRDSYEEFLKHASRETADPGIIITLRNGVITVVSTLKGYPAEGKVETGDMIFRINETYTRDISIFEAYGKLRGAEDTSVKILIGREGETEPIDLEIGRKMLKQEDAELRIFKDSIGYVRIPSFRTTKWQSIETAIAEMKNKNVTGIIVDLRGNADGDTEAGINLSKLFLSDKPVVTVRGRNSNNITYRSGEKAHVPETAIVVLVDKASAEASEIFAGAIKESRRGLIAGEKTFGKGRVQTLFPLANKSAIIITTASLYTPLGVSIHDSGIVPDYPIIEQEFPESVRKEIEKLEEGNRIEKFLAAHPKYSEEHLARFSSELKKEGITMDLDALENRIKFRKKVREEKLEPGIMKDVWLVEAIEILEETKKFVR